MIEDARVDSDEGGFVLAIEDSEAMSSTRSISWDALENLDKSLELFRAHRAEGEAVRREYEAAGRVSWGEYVKAQERTDPEFADGLAEVGDLLRKRDREGASVDPADETDYKDAA